MTCSLIESIYCEFCEGPSSCKKGGGRFNNSNVSKVHHAREVLL